MKKLNNHIKIESCDEINQIEIQKLTDGIIKRFNKIKGIGINFNFNIGKKQNIKKLINDIESTISISESIFSKKIEIPEIDF